VLVPRVRTGPRVLQGIGGLAAVLALLVTLYVVTRESRTRRAEKADADVALARLVVSEIVGHGSTTGQAAVTKVTVELLDRDEGMDMADPRAGFVVETQFTDAHGLRWSRFGDAQPVRLLPRRRGVASQE
jgi:hypothetical protein